MLNKLKVILLLCTLSFYSHLINGMDRVDEIRQYFNEQSSIAISILEALMSNQFSVDNNVKTFKFNHYQNSELELSKDMEYVQNLIECCLENFERETTKYLEKIKSDSSLRWIAIGYVAEIDTKLILNESNKYNWEIVRFGKFCNYNTSTNNLLYTNRQRLVTAILRSDYDNINLYKENLIKSNKSVNLRFISLDEEINNFLSDIRSEQTSINYFRLYKLLSVLGIQLLDFEP